MGRGGQLGLGTGEAEMRLKLSMMKKKSELLVHLVSGWR